jgi:hypothetical protein
MSDSLYHFVSIFLSFLFLISNKSIHSGTCRLKTLVLELRHIADQQSATGFLTEDQSRKFGTSKNITQPLLGGFSIFLYNMLLK